MRCNAKGRNKCFLKKENHNLRMKLKEYNNIIEFLKEVLETSKWHMEMKDEYVERVKPFLKKENPKATDHELKMLCLRKYMLSRSDLFNCERACHETLIKFYIWNTHNYIEIKP